MGGIMEGIVPLLDKQTDDGFHKGKLEVEHISHWIGDNALNVEEGPWHKLLSHGEGSAIGLESVKPSKTLLKNSTPT